MRLIYLEGDTRKHQEGSEGVRQGRGSSQYRVSHQAQGHRGQLQCSPTGELSGQWRIHMSELSLWRARTPGRLLSDAS